MADPHHPPIEVTSLVSAHTLDLFAEFLFSPFKEASFSYLAGEIIMGFCEEQLLKCSNDLKEMLLLQTFGLVRNMKVLIHFLIEMMYK